MVELSPEVILELSDRHRLDDGHSMSRVVGVLLAVLLFERQIFAMSLVENFVHLLDLRWL